MYLNIILTLSLVMNLITTLLLMFDAQEYNKLRTDLRITKRKLNRYRRKEVSEDGINAEN